MNKFTPHINVEYLKNNTLIFEEWFAQNYKGCKTDRELLPFFPTSYWVNNNYGNNEQAKQEAQDYICSLDKSKKYFSICQYDDGVLIHWDVLDVLEFNMNKKIGIEIPLICQPHPYKFGTPKKYIASFVGSRTHPIRNKLEKYKNLDGWYISFEPHDIETYCMILHESVFAICPRGYGLSSFRCYSEAIAYGCVPIYYSDIHVIPFGVDFNEFGIIANAADDLSETISALSELEILNKISNLTKYYDQYFTYDGCMNNIILQLEKEYYERVRR